MSKRLCGGLTRREALCIPLTIAAAPAMLAAWKTEEIRRFAAPEANQAVAVDAEHLYAIGDSAIAKYDKNTGKRVSGWACERGNPLIHLDSGVIHGGVLYCAHSNYPAIPMVSSIETLDTGTLQHTGSHSFGIFAGSATWVDLRERNRYVTFAHYRNAADEPDRNPRWTVLIEFDSEWRRLQAWVYPEEVVSKLGQFSISGGVFAPDGTLFCTGHDNPEIYVFRFPQGGSALVLEQTIATTIHGQGIALDPSDPGVLYGIDRPKREIIVTRLRTS